MQLDRFLGLNNVTDPLRAGFGFLTAADNIDITDTGALERREGYSQALAGAAITGAYGTRDFQRSYLVDSGELKSFDGSAAVTLASGLSAAPLSWDEINGQVFYANGTDSGVITRDHQVLPLAWAAPSSPSLTAVTGSLPAGRYRATCTFTLSDGRETGASDTTEIDLADGQGIQIRDIPQESGCTTNVYVSAANSTVLHLLAENAGAGLNWDAGSINSLGRELVTNGAFPLPAGANIIAFWMGRLYASQHLQSEGSSVVWFSRPLAFHLFDLERDYVMVPGRVVLIAPAAGGLVIGTTERTYVYDANGALATVADYGCVPGASWAAESDGSVLFWSQRGLCRALPFANLTSGRVSVAPGISAGLNLVERNGATRAVANLVRGGSAFNPRSQ